MPGRGFPVIQATNTSTDTAGTSHTLDLPSGVVDGNLLIAGFSINVGSTISWPGGWTELFEKENLSPGPVAFAVAYKTASSEGSTITVTSGSSGSSVHWSYRITGDKAAPIDGTAVIGTTEFPNPPSLNPSWGLNRTLFIATMSWNTGAVSIDSFPTNYGLSQIQVGGSHLIAAAAREIRTDAAEDPGTYDANAVCDWVANTLAVRGG